ncbi:MAG: FtsQ-type POTRA domain-containing protein [Candidatus Cybelea sp.]|jgi:cell division protein FtsQ
MIALAGVLSVAAGVFLTMWSGFDPRQVAVTGNRRVTSGEILRAADIPVNRSIWLDDTKAIAARIRAIPFVGTVSIHRLPPASFTIAVSERVPFAVVTSDDQSVVVDRALRVLCPATGNETLPAFVLALHRSLAPGTFVTARDAFVLRDVYATMASNGLTPTALTFDRYGDVVASISGGPRLLLGEPNDLARKVRLINAILAQVVRRQLSVSAVDVRAPATPVVVYR